MNYKTGIMRGVAATRGGGGALKRGAPVPPYSLLYHVDGWMVQLCSDSPRGGGRYAASDLRHPHVNVCRSS